MSTDAIRIADKAMALLQAATFDPAFKSFKRSPLRQVAANDLPLLMVYIIRERRTPDGDPNAGEPSFIHHLSLGIAGAIAASDGSELVTLEAMMANIDDVLLTNPEFVNMSEGIEGMDRRSQFASVAETPLAEIQIEMVLTFRSDWPPKIPDDFNTLHVETRYPKATTDPAIVEQIDREWDIPQN